ncbi:hypothetical protein LguiB_024213 [Lonicera macranthoides]
MIAFVKFARRFQRTPSQFFLPSTPPQIPSHSSSNSTHYFSQAFHPTVTVQSQPIPQKPHNFLEPININRYIDDTSLYNQLGNAQLLHLLKNANDFPSEAEAMAFLDKCDIKSSEGLVNLVIWGLKEEWKMAYWVFKWGEKWGFNSEKNWGLMIWVLGRHRKFNTAWCLIRDLHRAEMDTKPAMLVMIERYAAANDPSKAIQTFQTMEKFSMTPDLEAYYTLLNVLCKNGNIEEAEEFMFLNKKLFPLESEGFNIILNGWCNISVDVFEAKRVWREMSKSCILPNATSYTHMISCFSKVGNLFDSLRLYDEMKKRSWVPGLGVYNSLIYVLTTENCLNEAMKIVDKIKEMGLQPDSNTYNSMICPLCKSSKLEEARTLLAKMIGENISPTIETYHAFLEGASLEGTLEVLIHMEKAGFGPNRDTFLLILGKFLKLKEPESALKIWVEMNRYNVVPDSAHYTVLVEGLERCGLLMKAREFYAEMKFNGISDDPKLKKLLKEPLRESSRKSSGIKGKSRKQSRKKTKSPSLETH